MVRTALEIGFVCDSTPFWVHVGDILKARDSEQVGEKQRAEAERMIEVRVPGSNMRSIINCYF